MSIAKCINVAGSLPLIGWLLRKIAHRYAEGSVVTIRTGLARGRRWRRHHRYVNGYWIGNYELPVQDALARELQPGDTVYDVGANAGFLSLVALSNVTATGTCISVDPDPDNSASIREQIELNESKNWTVVQEAVSDTPGTSTFSRSTAGSSQAKLGDCGAGAETFEVPVTTLNEMVEHYPAPQLVKLDVEGFEGKVLQAADRLLNEIRPVWLIELHGRECEAEVGELLKNARYEFFGLGGEKIAADAPLPHHVVARPLPVAQAA